MPRGLRIIVSGLIAQFPLGGVTWDYLQYVLGLERLGHDVYYIEDTGQWPYNPLQEGRADDCSFNVAMLADVMSRFGLADRWAYCFPRKSRWFGLSDERRREVVSSADLLLNISGTIARPGDYRSVGRLAYVDSDPVFTQIKLARGQADFRRLIDAHDVCFSFGERLAGNVPQTGHDWRPTRQPILLSEWEPAAAHRGTFTTIMNWTSTNPVTYGGQSYGQKDVEFKRFLRLPSSVAPTPLEIAINLGKTRRPPTELLARNGWRVIEAAAACPDLDSYREYIRSSMAEWSVAKNGYVRGAAGWFSCRSACYLAAGRPVVVQDTGFSRTLPVGEGILPFEDMDQAAAAIRDVQRSYGRHSRAARAIAEQYFDSDLVLTRLVEEALEGGRTA